MNTAYKKQLNFRNRLALRFLMAELRQSKSYARELSNPGVVMGAEEREYKIRVISAAEKARTYCRNCPDDRQALLELLLKNNKKVYAVIDELHISKGTYDNWRKAILDVFGKGMGLWT
ncbi:MAG: hypothetical protein WC374_04765 [Phycisphaerae bacterium]|jgi:hypothetical protein